MLATRQFGYPMLGKSDDKELEEMVLHNMGVKDPALLHMITRSWEKVHTKGETLRKRIGMAKIPYE